VTTQPFPPPLAHACLIDVSGLSRLPAPGSRLSAPSSQLPAQLAAFHKGRCRQQRRDENFWRVGPRPPKYTAVVMVRMTACVGRVIGVTSASDACFVGNAARRRKFDSKHGRRGGEERQQARIKRHGLLPHPVMLCRPWTRTNGFLSLGRSHVPVTRRVLVAGGRVEGRSCER